MKSDNNPDLDVSGVIGMSGDVTGSVVLSFPQATAENLVALFGGSKADMGSPEFADAIGELVNMVAGGAKAMFKNRKCAISTPSVIVRQEPPHRAAERCPLRCHSLYDKLWRLAHSHRDQIPVEAASASANASAVAAKA
jgi:CheY-specific phosphatase CheX